MIFFVNTVNNPNFNDSSEGIYVYTTPHLSHLCKLLSYKTLTLS